MTQNTPQIATKTAQKPRDAEIGLSEPDAVLLRLIDLRGFCTYQSLKSLISSGWMPNASAADTLLNRLVADGHLVPAPHNPRHYVRPGRAPALTPPPKVQSRANRIEAALPNEGSIRGAMLARAVGLRPNRTPYKRAIALLINEGRIASPQHGYYTRPGLEHTHASLEDRILLALRDHGLLTLHELKDKTHPGSRTTLSRTLTNLVRTGRLEMNRSGLQPTYARVGTTPPDVRFRGVVNELRAIFADGQIHRTQDLVDTLSTHANNKNVRQMVKKLSHAGEIINVARGAWQLNDGRTRPRTPPVPAIERIRHVLDQLDSSWSRRDLESALAQEGAAIPQGTIKKALHTLQNTGEIVQTARGIYRQSGR